MVNDRPWLRGALLVATVTVVSVAGGAAVVAAQDTPIDPEAAARAAAAPKPFTAPDHPATIDVTGCLLPGAGDWRPLGADLQAAADLDNLLAQRYLSGGKDSTRQALSRGLIGVAADGVARGYVVVVDPTVLDVKALGADLAGLKAARPVRVQTGCYSAAAVRATLDEVQRLADAYGATYGAGIDRSTSQVDVRMRVESDAALAIAERLGDRVSVTEGTDSPAD